MIKSGYLVRSDQPVEQLEEVVIRFNLFKQISSFTRCIHCNGLLQEAEKSDVLDKFEPLTRRYYHRFTRCRSCGHVYWAGSHRERLDPKPKELLDIG